MSTAQPKAALSADLIGHDPELAEALAELREGLEPGEDALFINLGKREPDRDPHPEARRESTALERRADQTGAEQQGIPEDSETSESAQERTNPDLQGPEFNLLPPTYVPPRELPAREIQHAPTADSIHVRETLRQFETSGKLTRPRAWSPEQRRDSDLSGLAWPSPLSKLTDPLTPAGPLDPTVVKPRRGPRLVLWSAFGLATLLLLATLLVRGFMFPQRNTASETESQPTIRTGPDDHSVRSVLPPARRTEITAAPAVPIGAAAQSEVSSASSTPIVEPPTQTPTHSSTRATVMRRMAAARPEPTPSAQAPSPRSPAPPRPPHPEPEF